MLEARRSETVRKIYERVPHSGEPNYTDLSLSGGATSPESVEKILKYLTPRQHNFYDLGSGRGEVIIQAGFSNKKIKAVGIEIIKERHDDALKALKLARSEEFKMPKDAVDLQLINNSFLNVDFSDADVVYVSALAFSDDTMKELESRFVNLKDDAVIIVVDKELDIRRFKLQGEDNYKMGYGNGNVSIYKKREDMGAEFINR